MDSTFSSLPPEFLGDAEAIRRKQAVADALARQAMTTIAEPASRGRFRASVSPVQGAGQIMQGYAASQLKKDLPTPTLWGQPW